MADESYKDANRITLVMDNLDTHSPSALYGVFELEEAKRYHQNGYTLVIILCKKTILAITGQNA